MTKENEEFQKWSNDVAVLAADAVIDAKLINKEKFEDAVAVIGEEIFVRLIIGDYPPPLKTKLLSKEIE